MMREDLSDTEDKDDTHHFNSTILEMSLSNNSSCCINRSRMIRPVLSISHIGLQFKMQMYPCTPMKKKKLSRRVQHHMHQCHTYVAFLQNKQDKLWKQLRHDLLLSAMSLEKGTNANWNQETSTCSFHLQRFLTSYPQLQTTSSFNTPKLNWK